jgi:hypothetical protein
MQAGDIMKRTKTEQTEYDKAIQEYLENGGKITVCARGDSGLAEEDRNPWGRKKPGRPKTVDKK